jgi:hypothetical protein
MATKTISIDLDAYERLRRARRAPDESFSQVIKRAEWPDHSRSAASLLKALETQPLVDSATLDRLGAAQEADAPPEDSWRSA